MVKMEVASVSHTAYVLNAANRSGERAVTAVDLGTQKTRQVIQIGKGKRADLLISQDGRCLFVYTISGKAALKGIPEEPSHFQNSGGSNIVTAIDSSSNRVISTFDLLHASGLEMPKSKAIETFLFPSPDGRGLLVRVEGFARIHPIWNRLVFFPIPLTGSPVAIDPGKPFVSYWLSKSGRFLFTAAEDKAGQSELVRIVNLENGKTIDRAVDDPMPTLAHHQRLSPFFGGAPPAAVEEAQDGIWMRTRVGLRFISETGEMGDEISVPEQSTAAALLSLDRSRWFVAVPDESQHAGTFYVVDLKKNTASSSPLTYAPIKLIRLGQSRRLWIISKQEIRPISETGDLGNRAILLNKPRKMEAGETSAGDDLFLSGEPGETIGLGEDRAAILVTGKTGNSAHRVALLNLTQFRLDAILTTMSAGERAKIRSSRLLKMMGQDALAGALNGAIAGGYGTPSLGAPAAPQPFGAPVIEWWALGNEALAAAPDGRNLYVLNTDTHEVSVIDVMDAAVVRRIKVDESVNKIQISANGKHLICIGPGLLREFDLGRTTMS